MTAIATVTASLWHAPASSDEPGEIESLCESYLDEDDRRRAEQFRRPTTRNQHVIGRGMARRLLTGGNLPPEVVRFSVAEGGKPFAADPPQARRSFNVAHTDGLVVCGLIDTESVGDEIPLGVDVERLDRRVDLNLAHRYFSSPEIESIDRLPDDRQRRIAFLRIWTLKESFIKAIGTGLRTPLDQFAFEAIDSQRPRITFLNPDLASAAGGQGHWHFQCVTPRPGYVAAVAVEIAAHQRLDARIISFAELVG